MLQKHELVEDSRKYPRVMDRMLLYDGLFGGLHLTFVRSTNNTAFAVVRS